MLEALAVIHGYQSEAVTTVLDAGRGELYVGEYEILNRTAVLRSQSMPKLTEFLTQFPSSANRIITTFPKLAEIGATAAISVELVKPLQADAIGRIGLRKLQVGETSNPATLDANYIRRSDAELYAPPKP
jgi:tRNA threonylcarbamoyladenosine biosynthesis protein TsaB